MIKHFLEFITFTEKFVDKYGQTDREIITNLSLAEQPDISDIVMSLGYVWHEEQGIWFPENIFSKKLFYSLFDLQTCNLLATGLNTNTLGELFEDYCCYKSIDAWDEEDWRQHWSTLSTDEKLSYIREDEFFIEVQDEPFEEWW